MAPSAAPWRGLFLASFEKSRVSTFNLTTIAHAPSKRPVPRSRTVEFRGFWPKPASTLHKSGIEALKTQDIGLNPDVYESDLLSVTTDARMGKVGQLADSDDVVEGVFWFEEVSAQWRVRGRAVTIGAPEEDEEERQVREMVKKGMREKKGDGEGNIKDWDWERQVATYFANHSPVMRGTFKNPPPGRPRSEAPSDPQLKLGQKIEDLKDPIARANFRVLLILPQEMEVLDFSNPDDVRRTRWTLANRDEGKWKETELWP